MKNYDLIWNALKNCDYGTLAVTLPDGVTKNFIGKNSGPAADVLINDDRLIDLVISGGDVAFGEAYMDGFWESSNLADFLTFLTLNSHALEDFFHARKLQALLLFFKSLFAKNTKKGSKKNISAHYDLGNDFYQLWLDESMTYSSAIFENEDSSLLEAQQKKYQRILSKLNPGNVLEIGCGWGGFAQISAESGRKITGLTISQKQHDYASNRLKEAGLESLCDIKLQDYRDEKTSYDNVVSIEMFEAVGGEYWKKYFQVLCDSLKSKGKAVLQIITIDEQVFADYRNRVDFIQKHIFPGGVLPSKSVIRELAKSHGFEVKSEFAFGLDYAKTLMLWLERFDAKHEEVRALGFSEEFLRKWRFYLCYCIAGFNAKRTDVVQFELEKIT
jgi:cyclopropane-fatty-acyl-phospholipid synthase